MFLILMSLVMLHYTLVIMIVIQQTRILNKLEEQDEKENR